LRRLSNGTHCLSNQLTINHKEIRRKFTIMRVSTIHPARLDRRYFIIPGW
jgi:hypothetical protein